MGATTFTVGYGDIIRPYSAYGSIKVRSFPEAASQSFLLGEPLILNGTGSHKNTEVKVASNDPTANIVGVAAQGATGSEFTSWSGVGGGGWGSRTDSSVLAAGQASSLGPGIAGSLGLGVCGTYQNVAGVATLQGNGGTKGLVQVWLATWDSLFVGRVISGNAISNDNVGIQCGLEKDATNLIWRVDDGDTGNKCVQIVGLFDNDGDINGRYIFKFVAATNVLFGER